MNEYELLLETYHKALLKGRVKNKGDFASVLEIAPATLSRAFKGTPEFLTSGIVEKCKQLLADMGDDMPARTDADALALYNTIENAHEESEKQGYTLPLVPINAVAGFNGIDEAGVVLEECPQYVVPEFRDARAEFLIRVSGSSMYPKYSSGDILACRKIREVTFFQWGKVYVIDSQQGAMVKRLFEVEGCDDFVLCKSDNENYPPFKLPKDEIRSLSIVVGVIRME